MPFLLAFLLVCANVLPREAVAVLMVAVGVIFVLRSKLRIDGRFLRLMFPLTLLAGIAGVMGLTNGKSDYVHEGALWFTAWAMLASGYYLGSKVALPTAIAMMVLAGVASAVAHLINFFSLPGFMSYSMNDLRNLGPSYKGFSITVVSIFLLIFLPQGMRRVFPFAIRLPCLFIMLLSFFLSYSRTFVIESVLILVGICGVLVPGPAHRWKRVVGIVVALSALGGVYAMYELGNARESLLSKLLWSLQEVNTDVDVRQAGADLHTKWRGYEAKMGLQMFESGSLLHKVLGFGLGALVHLNTTIELGGDTYSEVATLHNGYIYMLVKTGCLGVAIYVGFLLSLIRTGRREFAATDVGIFAGRWLTALALFSLANTFVNTGLFHPVSWNDLVLIGYFYRVKMQDQEIAAI
jgi:hypothetical protein